MESYTPYSALIGGAFIGLAAVVLLWCNGRIAGISGIVSGLLRPKKGDSGWRISFVIGLLLGAACYLWLAPPAFEPRTGFSNLKLIAAGLLVGIGTGLGNGCTSGHGVCGIARLSMRSIIATATFLGMGMLTVYLLARF
jgi:uncharacterized membrane protein YedE/YeeE